MAGTFTRQHSFRRGCLGRDGQLLLLLINDELALAGEAHSSVVLWDNGRFKPVTTTPWTAGAIVPLGWPDAEFAVIGENGQLLKVRRDAAFTEERVFAQDPAKPCLLKGAACIEGVLFTAGAGFGCAVVGADGTRRDISPYRMGSPTEGCGVGFEAITGNSPSDVLAVGWDGALWHFDGTLWHPQSSPVNLILSHATHLPDGEYWACGQSGTVVRGRPGEWAALETGVQDNLWSIVPYGGGLVAASSRELFRFELDDDEPQRIGLESDPQSFYWLDAKNDEVLLSTGNKNVVLVVPDREIVIDQ